MVFFFLNISFSKCKKHRFYRNFLKFDQTFLDVEKVIKILFASAISEIRMIMNNEIVIIFSLSRLLFYWSEFVD